MSTKLLALSLSVCLGLSTLVAAADEPTLEQRLEKLTQSLEAARVEAHIPGMSLAIVKNGKVVLARGFGVADLDDDRPADEQTIYAVGSTTKAFTATLVGMMVDEGRASWDDAVTEYLPYFDLQVRSEDANASCTLRDLLSHRHGFSRMSILWFGGQLSRSEVLHTAAGAEPWDDFRAGFHYCNVTYLAAGEAAGVAGESTWDEMMVERIFEPLGMTSSTVATSEARKDARLALGYRWDATSERLLHEDMVDLGVIGPAGSVNSNVVDMAQWLRLQLGQGEVDGMQLVSKERLRETWSPQIEIAGGVSYGLGWMLREHDGRKVVEHGGNIDGFSAQIGLMPEEELGYVLLMNLDMAPLQQASLGLVFDALLDPWPAADVADGTAPITAELDLEDYAGTYVANFASFRDEPFEVLIQDASLALDIPSQQTFGLALPNEDGKWSFTLTSEIAVSFQRGPDGEVVGLTLHQSGYDFEVPRQGAAVVSEVPAEELQKYTGTFVRAEGGKRITISIQRGRLTLEDKGQMLAFHTPDPDGHAALRAHVEHGATFDVDPEGNVDSLMFHGDSGDKLFTRLKTDREEALPSLDELFALRDIDARLATMAAEGGTRSTGKVWIAQAGVRGTVIHETNGDDRFASRMNFGRVGRIDVAVKGGEACRYNSMRGFEVLTGDELAQVLLEHPAAVYGDWRAYFDSVEVLRNDSVGDRPVHVVRLESGDLPSRSYWVDAENGDILRVKMTALERTMRIPVTIDYSDFEVRNGIRVPKRVEVANPASGKTVLTFDTFEAGLTLGDEVFTLEDPEAGEGAGD